MSALEMHHDKTLYKFTLLYFSVPGFIVVSAAHESMMMMMMVMNMMMTMAMLKHLLRAPSRTAFQQMCVAARTCFSGDQRHLYCIRGQLHNDLQPQIHPSTRLCQIQWCNGKITTNSWRSLDLLDANQKQPKRVLRVLGLSNRERKEFLHTLAYIRNTILMFD